MSPKGRNRNQTDVQVIVIKQLGYSDNLTALYITMKLIINFYRTVLTYLQATEEINGAIDKIVELAAKANPSWEATAKSVAFLEQCVNRGSTVDEDEEFATCNSFAKAAFRDLSVLKDDIAMELFRELAQACVPTFAAGDDIFIWARTVKERLDGSAVLVIHVTDLARFRRLLEQHDLADSSSDDGTLEGVVQIGS